MPAAISIKAPCSGPRVTEPMGDQFGCRQTSTPTCLPARDAHRTASPHSGPVVADMSVLGIQGMPRWRLHGLRPWHRHRQRQVHFGPSCTTNCGCRAHAQAGESPRALVVDDLCNVRDALGDVTVLLGLARRADCPLSSAAAPVVCRPLRRGPDRSGNAGNGWSRADYRDPKWGRAEHVFGADASLSARHRTNPQLCILRIRTHALLCERTKKSSGSLLTCATKARSAGCRSKPPQW